jgi:NhaP-type Na+/H+ or K+/H+ antiporter
LVRGDYRGVKTPSGILTASQTCSPNLKLGRLALVLVLTLWASSPPPATAAAPNDRLPGRAFPDPTTSAGSLVYAYNWQNPRPHEPMPQRTPKVPRSARSPEELARRRRHREASTLLSEQALAGVTALIALTVGSQWLITIVRFPAIVLAVTLGLLAGPASGFINVDALFGNLLLPLVSLSLAVILYEESRSVRFAELRPIRGPLVSLIAVGLLVTGLAGTGAAYLVLNLAPPVALLLGIVVTLTGPAFGTSRAQPDSGQASFAILLEREGVLLDLIGTLLVVLVFQGILFGAASFGSDALVVIVNTIWMGAVVGLVATAATGMLLNQRLVPGFLRGSVSLVLVTATYTAAELLQPSSGFIAVTVMGLALANWGIERAQCEEQQVHMRPLLAVGLLIVAAARLQPMDIAEIDPASILFLGIVVTARFLAVALAPLQTGWSWRERLLLAALAPRGVMVAGLATLFGLRLAEVGLRQAAGIAPLALLVVLATAALDALAAPLLPRWLRPAAAGSQPQLTHTPQAG